MEFDEQKYLEECNRLRLDAGLPLSDSDNTLSLASPVFGAYAGGGTSAPAEDSQGRSKKLAKANRRTATTNATGGGAFEESEHPRGPGGKFISKGDSGTAVEAAQEALGIKTDGEFGKQTVKRLREFQRNNDLQVDGVIGQQTAAALLGNENADDIAPGALRPGQYKRLVSVLNKKKK